ncbi:zinc ribbon domain-containing protein, partial [Mycobacterium sp.]|uniref:zinc ribbon domain-containing protein n=1 Tax=Mycobacterium sp. TaxID=1785 RepID=UPI0039C8C1B4
MAIRLGAALARVGGWRRERSGRRHPDSGGWSGVEALFEPSECRLSCVFGLGFDVFDDGGELRRSRAAGGLDSRRKLERGAKATKWPYAVKGMVRCALCGRRMEGTPRRSKNESRTYYRCAARSIVPGSAVL